MTDGRDFIALSGDVRAMGEADDSINRIATERGRKFLTLYSFYYQWLIKCLLIKLVLRNVFSYTK